ncbi:hypothetical protein BJX99DRAFT_255321 [Aspergillus californicus]
MVVHLVKEGVKIGDSTSQDLSRIQCFTVQFDQGSGVDESDIAQHTAEYLGVKFNPVYMTEEILAERFEPAVWHSEAVMADMNGPDKLALAEIAKQHGFKVVITALCGSHGYTIDGPVHTKLKELSTKENIENMGFIDWEETKNLVSKGLEDHDPFAFRMAVMVAQYVTISKRFGVKRASPDAN